MLNKVVLTFECVDKILILALLVFRYCFSRDLKTIHFTSFYVPEWIWISDLSSYLCRVLNSKERAASSSQHLSLGMVVKLG